MAEIKEKNLSPETKLNHIEESVNYTELEKLQPSAEKTPLELDLDDTDRGRRGTNDLNSPELKLTSLENHSLDSPISTDNSSDEADGRKLVEMIPEQEQLVEPRSGKLNISSTNSAAMITERQQPHNIVGNTTDDSIIELVESWFNLGLKQVSTGDFSGAIASWEKALNLNPNLSEAWHNRGSALGRLSKYEEAIESFERSLAVAPDNYQAWNDRAHALYQLQKWQEATRSWDKAIEIMPSNHLFWYSRGCALEQLNNIDESIASYEKALEIRPDFQPARSRYINLVADNSPSN